MKALVTGVSGFTGSHLARALLGRGYEVHGFVRSAGRAAGLAREGVVLHEGNLTDADSVARAVEGMDAVYHIAASYREAGLPDAEYHNVNVLGTKHVLDAALRGGVKRLVHCSTVGVHGHVENPPADEEAPFNPGDPYQRTKLEGEKLVLDYVGRGLPAAVFRPVGIYGPGDRRFLKLFRAIRKGTFVMFGKGDVLYHLTYIDDLVRGIIACGENEKALGQVFIIAGEKATTLRELADRIAVVLGVRPPRWRLPFGALWTASVLCEGICRPLGLEPPLFRRRADFFRKDRAFNASKIARLLGVQPQVNLEEGLRRTAGWYRAEGLL
jgi:dihydroflavonol-4-reductase